MQKGKKKKKNLMKCSPSKVRTELEHHFDSNIFYGLP